MYGRDERLPVGYVNERIKVGFVVFLQIFLASGAGGVGFGIATRYDHLLSVFIMAGLYVPNILRSSNNKLITDSVDVCSLVLVRTHLAVQYTYAYLLPLWRI